MNRTETSGSRRRGPAALLMTLLLSALALGVVAQPAGAVAVINVWVAEEMASEYAWDQCLKEQPTCESAGGGPCRQQGKFQATCKLWKDYEIEPAEGPEEYWTCHRRVRYTVEKRPYYRHKKWISHRKFLSPWNCEHHHIRPQY